MSNVFDISLGESSQPGQRLAAWVDALRGDLSVREWASRHGLDDAQISAWRTGRTVPSVDAMRRFAAAVGKTFGDVLIAAGLADATDLTATPPPPADVRYAIANDPPLDDWKRGVLVGVLDAVQNVRAEDFATLVVRNRPAGRR